MFIKNLTTLSLGFFLISTSTTYAVPAHQFYGAIQAGVFRAQFNNKYSDQTDIIPQNITNASMQNGYSGGLTLGYTHTLNANYFVSIDLSGDLDGNSALYQSGATNTAFSDTININHHIDLSFMPGVISLSRFYPYLKIGISYASITDHLNSPVGYEPIFTDYSSHKNSLGLVLGMGVRYIVNDHLWLFVETNYHDYGSTHLTSFQNFTASYTHSAHLYSYGTLLGAAYSFNV